MTTSEVRRAPGGRSVIWAVVGIFIMQAVWIVALPPFRGSDEFDHAFRAASVARGHWQASEPAAHGRGDLVSVPRDIVAAAREQCQALKYTGRDNCAPVRAAGGGDVLIASGASRYNPGFYYVVGAAALPFEGATALQAMRFANALLCSAIFGLSVIAIKRWSASVWPPLGLMVALTPVLVYSSAVPAPNALEIMAALSIWSALTGLLFVDPASSSRLLLLPIPGIIVVANVRYLGPLFLVLILGVISIALGASRIRAIASSRRWEFFSLVGSVAVGLLSGLIWTVTARTTTLEQPLNVPLDWGRVIESPPLWWLQSIAAFPLRDEPAPGLVYVLYLFVFGLLVGGALRVRDRLRWSLLVLLGIAVALPIFLTIGSFSSRGAVIWQGRYGLPLGVGICVLAGAAMQIKQPRHRFVAPFVLSGVLALGISQALSVGGFLSKESSHMPSAADPNWLKPDPLVTSGLMAAGFVLLVISLASWVKRMPARAEDS